jgi:hypothetical protein
LDTDSLSDGGLYALDAGTWKSVERLSAIQGSTRRLSLAYVIKTWDGTERHGVLVMKSNRPAVAGDTERARDMVALIRRGVTADVGCKPLQKLDRDRTEVSTAAYRDYHDLPAKDTDALREYETRLTRFHFEYRSAFKRRCARTDDKTSDDIFDWNSNRAQFSFDPGVVATGMYTTLRLFGWLKPASPFEGTVDNRTQVKKYDTAGGLACVRFSVPIRGDGYSIRISDLEAHQPPPATARIGEKQF